MRLSDYEKPFFHQGMAAYAAGLTPTNNPYALDTWQATAWLSGWELAAEFDGRRDTESL